MLFTRECQTFIAEKIEKQSVEFSPPRIWRTFGKFAEGCSGRGGGRA
jgi:hypothetical protein